MDSVSFNFSLAEMGVRLNLLLILGSLLLLFGILELVRRRRLKEKYSLVWIFTAMTLFVLSIGRDIMRELSSLMGIHYPPSAFFLLAFLFLMLIMIQFSVVISNLSARNKALAHELSLIKLKLDEISESQKSKGGQGEG